MKRELQLTFEVEAASNCELALYPIVLECVKELSMGTPAVGRVAHRTVNDLGGTATVVVRISAYHQNINEDDDREATHA